MSFAPHPHRTGGLQPAPPLQSPSPALPRRRVSPRNPRINYRNGWFFVTCQIAHNKSILGAISDGRFLPSPLGAIVDSVWRKLPATHPELAPDDYVVMPNHFHAVVHIRQRDTNKLHHLGHLVGRLKGATAHAYGEMRADGRCPDIGPALWQRSYWDNLVTSPAELDAIRRYIRANPSNWERDRFGPCTTHVRGNTALLGGPLTAFVASQGHPASDLHPRLFRRTPVPALGTPSLISTFTSAQEREALRRALAKHRPIVWVCPRGIPPDDALPPPLLDALRAGRALLVSPRPPDSPLDKKIAAWCNTWLLRHSREIWTGALTPGGLLETLLHNLP